MLQEKPRQRVVAVSVSVMGCPDVTHATLVLQHQVFRSRGAGTPSRSLLPESADSLAPQQGVMPQAGMSLEGVGGAFGEEIVRPKLLGVCPGTVQSNSEPRKLTFPKALVACGITVEHE